MTRKDLPTLSAQHAYVARLKGEGFKFGLTVGDAFVRGIRDLGYKSNADALAELIDNSCQAGASRVDVAFGYDDSSDKKPVALAVIDDGHGMEADMIRLAVLWGGTHREGDRTGMGRYGYGLPSSCVSIGQSFTVYSKAPGGEVFAVTIDLPAISAGEYTDEAGEIIVPAPQPASLPPFVQAQIDAAYPQGWTSGTAVVIDKLDRLEWTTAAGLRENFSRRFGVTYHKLREAFALYVDGAFV
ncbi:MAG TPA: ATP-binding protein, partial [Caulobacteraceae bacterium]|nr:ATP-binding protein [Caulobacteraceae bacterium]